MQDYTAGEFAEFRIFDASAATKLSSNAKSASRRKRSAALTRS